MQALQGHKLFAPAATGRPVLPARCTRAAAVLPILSSSRRRQQRLAPGSLAVRCQAAPDGTPRITPSPDAQASLPGSLGRGDFPAGSGTSAEGLSAKRARGAGLAAEDEVADVTLAGQQAHEIDWEAWSAYFEEMDESGTRVRELATELAEAVAAEDYCTAAALKNEMDTLVSKDVVAAVLKELNVALESEQYARAAQLRDEGGAGLLGWWCGRGSEDDPYGHLLHMTAEFGRYVGTAYQARDLAEVKGWTEDSFLRGSVPRTPKQLSELGTPIMEVFVRDKEDGSAGFQRQVVALSPAEDLAATDLMVELGEGMEGASDVTVVRGTDEDGSDYVKVSVTFEEGPPTGGFSLADPQDQGLEEDLDPQSQGSDLLSRDGKSTLGSSGSSSSSLADSTPYDAIYDDDVLSGSGLFGSLGGGSGDGDNGLSLSGTTMLRVGEEEIDLFMSRHRAVLRSTNRDSFEFEVPATELAVDGMDEDEQEEVSLRQQDWQQLERPRTSGRWAADSTDEESDQQQPQAGPSGRAGPGGLRDTLVHFAGDQAASTSSNNSGAAGTDQRAEEARRLARELSRNSSSRDSSSSASSSSSGNGLGGIVLREVPSSPVPMSGGKVRYQRLATTGVRTDPLTGLYLGAFGSHGPELLQLSRGTWQDGEEMVYGVKVTGDPNVPAGSLSFRAKVGRRHRLDPSEEYPPELGVVARYKGEGRIAATGYRNPRWVEGELLQFSSGTPVTRGAQLGFVFCIPEERKFLILLNRIDLSQF